MKKLTQLFFAPLMLTAASNISYAQINLVPNGNLEDTVLCPSTLDQIEACAGCLKFRSSPDYFNACAPNGSVSVPVTPFGYQPAHSGYGMMGVTTYDITTLNYREHVGFQLLQPLSTGLKYFFSCYINCNGTTSNSFNMASDKFGVRFSNTQYSLTNPSPVTNSSVILSDTMVTNNMGWYRITGSFIPTQAYQYIIIGNFFDDGNTNTLIQGINPVVAYYYVDDICLSSDSIFCSLFTDISNNESETNFFSNYDVPSQSIIIKFINNNYAINRVSVYDLLGRNKINVTPSNSINSSGYSIPYKNAETGIYILEVILKNNLKVSKKIFVNP